MLERERTDSSLSEETDEKLSTVTRNDRSALNTMGKQLRRREKATIFTDHFETSAETDEQASNQRKKKDGNFHG